MRLTKSTDLSYDLTFQLLTICDKIIITNDGWRGSDHVILFCKSAIHIIKTQLQVTDSLESQVQEISLQQPTSVYLTNYQLYQEWRARRVTLKKLKTCRKMEDLTNMGIPCAFCYVAPCSGGLIFTGDPRMTDIITTDVEKLL